MPIGADTDSWRRKLPHLQKMGKTYAITFCTLRRRVLSDLDRSATLAACVDTHTRSCFLHGVVVMPDHVHLAATPYESVTLPKLVQMIKSVASHRIGRGRIWQREYFDRIIRSTENLRNFVEYIIANPVRAGLVDSVEDYPWIWRWWVEGEVDVEGPASPPGLDRRDAGRST